MYEWTNQAEKFEEVKIGVEFVLNDLKTLRGENTHGIAHSIQAPTARENKETLKKSLTAGDVLQMEIRNSICKLRERVTDFKVKIKRWGELMLLCQSEPDLNTQI